MRHTYSTLSLIAVIALSACHDDKSSPAQPLTATTYDSASGLELFYNGQPMPSKTVTLTPDGTKANLKIYSLFDLSEITGMGLSGKIPAPGAIPGTPELNLDVTMVDSDGTWKFSGDSSTDYCDFNYMGVATDKGLKLYLNDVKLKSGGVKPEVWQPSPIVKNADRTYKSLPFYIDWQYDPLPDVDISLTPIIDAIATLPVIPVYNNTAYMSVSEALSEIVKTVAFLEDGNMVLTYVSSSFGAMQIAQTQPNRFQYVIASPQSVKLYLDPMSLFGMLLVNTSGGTSSSDVDLTDKGLFPASSGGTSKDDEEENTDLKLLQSKIMKSALSYFMPRLAEGLPMLFNAGSDGLHIYIDTEMALGLFNEIVLPLLKEDASVKAIEAYLASNPTFAPLLPDLKKALQALPQAIEKTTTFRIGFSFTPYTSTPS